jgi:excinuclease ABC subunit B
MFNLQTQLKPQGDQRQAIKKLVAWMQAGHKYQTLLGATATGKTYTIAKVIQKVQKPTLVISHNKTLASQLYQEFRDFFPKNEVHYFVSYYDYYQPEAYLPAQDIYIEKDASINEEIDRLRHGATQALLAGAKTLVVASVSCIYNLGSPEKYQKISLELHQGQKISVQKLAKKLSQLQYERNDWAQLPGTFRKRGDTLDIFSPTGSEVSRIEFWGDKITSLSRTKNSPTEAFLKGSGNFKQSKNLKIYPAKHFITEADKLDLAIANIKAELEERLKYLKQKNQILYAQRLRERTLYDIEMLETTGYVSGIENYSRHLDFRQPGAPPYSLLDYFRASQRDFLVVIDESHISLPQIRGMYLGDRSRKQTLIDYGFRLPSALDNRPLNFEEFLERAPQLVFMSATPTDWELERSSAKRESAKPCLLSSPDSAKRLLSHGASKDSRTPFNGPRGRGARGGRKGLALKYGPNDRVAEQIIRPTGLLEPQVEVRPTKNQIQEIIQEAKKRAARNERTLITVLTKRLAENLTEYLLEAGLKAEYLHSEIKTLERPEILYNLRSGEIEVLVGVNLLREGLDLPEVSLVIILDADKEGFLRSEVSLIQTIGRAARNVRGTIIMYADSITGSMKRAIEETERRREIQAHYNHKHRIIPKTIKKPVKIFELIGKKAKKKEELAKDIEARIKNLKSQEKAQLLKELQKEMFQAAENLEFEKAALLRDKIKGLSG